jgi:hypothetical protein
MFFRTFEKTMKCNADSISYRHVFSHCAEILEDRGWNTQLPRGATAVADSQ